MALHWKLYDRNKKLLAGTTFPEEMAMLLSARGAIGDTVKFRGLVALRVRDEADAREIGLSYDNTARRMWTEYRTAYAARIARLNARALRHTTATAAGLLEAGRAMVEAVVVGDGGTHADPPLAQQILERAAQ